MNEINEVYFYREHAHCIKLNPFNYENKVEIYLNIVFELHIEHLPFRKIITLASGIHKKQGNTFCAENVKFLNVKPVDACSNPFDFQLL